MLAFNKESSFCKVFKALIFCAIVLLLIVYDLSEVSLEGSAAYQTTVDVCLCKQLGSAEADTDPPYWIRIAAAVASS